MTLEYIRKNLDGLDEAIQILYEKDGESFKLKVAGLPEVEDVTGLKNTLEKVRTDLKQTEKQLKLHKDIDPEKHAQLLKEKAEHERLLEQNRLELARKEKDTKVLEETLLNRHGKTIENLKQEYESKLSEREAALKAFEKEMSVKTDVLSSALHNEMISKRAISSLIEAEGDPFILKDMVASQLKIVEEDGKFHVRVPAEDGTSFLKNDKGDYLTEKDVIAKMQQDPRYANNFNMHKLDGGSGHFNNQNKTKEAPNVTGADRIRQGLLKQNG